MKVVINTSIGGFGISPTTAYFMEKDMGIPCYIFARDRDESGEWLLIPIELSTQTKYGWVAHSTLNPVKGDRSYGIFSDIHDDRSNPSLVKAVETLGPEASGKFSNLKVVDIPDGVEYIVMTDNNGREWIAEKHRT